MLYIGKTKHLLRQRLLDHIYNIKVWRLNRPICQRVGLKHKYDPKVITCRVLEHNTEPTQGGEWNSIILQRETRWIFQLRATEY